jgi:hypothetical protein
MEELSRGKEPEEFFCMMKKMIQGGGRPPSK